MNRHQVLTGAANHGDRCYAVGSVEGINFVTYAAGCDIVILSRCFKRVQIIPGAVHGNIQVSCVDACEDTGKIAASYGSKVCIFEPTPTIPSDQSHNLHYQWYFTSTIQSNSVVSSVSLDLEGARLLTGGDMLQMWTCSSEPAPEVLTNCNSEAGMNWHCAWQRKTASPIQNAVFSSDGELFATIGEADRLVKIWFESKKLKLPSGTGISSSKQREPLNYSFIYLAHPQAVTGFTWRRTSKYMPRGAIANVLITSCTDNICRIWAETILPEDGLIDLAKVDPMAQNSELHHAQRHKNRLLQTLQHMQSVSSRHQMFAGNTCATECLTSLPSSQSEHDFHKFGIHPNSVAPCLHFHVAASINPDTDIPLPLPLRHSGQGKGSGFVVHWLNNKELHFTLEAELLLARLNQQQRCQDENSDEDTSSSANASDANSVTNANPVKREFLTKSQSHISTDSEFSVTSMGSAQSHSTALFTGVPVTSADTSSKGGDALDRKVECLLADWHGSSDMLFSVHPTDGSFLVWLIDWLDECSPGSWRQAQVSFSSCLPQALPAMDAITMSTAIHMFCAENPGLAPNGNNRIHSTPFDSNPLSSAMSGGKISFNILGDIMMLTKHSNGSLNLWNVSFADGSRYSTIVSVQHRCRVCGHRFRTNRAACHPVLPLLLTSSHHNAPSDIGVPKPSATNNHSCDPVELSRFSSTNPFAADVRPPPPSEDQYGLFDQENPGPRGFCSELILWRVDPIGPLSKSGGLTELSRIHYGNSAAFSHFAWLPTLLPSSTLGDSCNSPSALFVASDGRNLRVYQAVIDARSLLSELKACRTNSGKMEGTCSNDDNSPSFLNARHPMLSQQEMNIVSLQSTARPGCVIELCALDDANQEFQNLDLLHAFQEQLITGLKSTPLKPSPTVQEPCDSSQSSNDRPSALRMGNPFKVQFPTAQEPPIHDFDHVDFAECFYLVLLESIPTEGSLLHMWKIMVESQHVAQVPEYSPDGNFFQAVDKGSSLPRSHNFFRSSSGETSNAEECSSGLSITTSKVCTQRLLMPPGVRVIHTDVAAGHLSSSSIYPACLAPYLITTVCSDGRCRFWTVTHKPARKISCSLNEEENFVWNEWGLTVGNDEEESSSIRLPGKPITVSSAYSGRMAVAYRLKGGNISCDQDRFINLCVSIYECESTGSSEWTLEDAIELRNIPVPAGILPDLDMTFISPSCGGCASDMLLAGTASAPLVVRTSSIPSISTIHSVRRTLSTCSNSPLDVLVQKHLVQLDWVTTEDGAHVLTVAVGSKIMLYAAVSSEMLQSVTLDKDRANKKSARMSGSMPQRRRGVLTKSKSMTVANFVEEIRWIKLRVIDLLTADGLPPLPMHISWVRDGILVVGMDNEMHVYSQWKAPKEVQTSPSLAGDSLLVQLSSPSSASLNHLKSSVSSMNIRLTPSASNLALVGSSEKKKSQQQSKATAEREEKEHCLALIQDCGLFEACRLANPVLPQYHPKQLLELLNFGKIRRVKAILAHLTRCVTGAAQSMVSAAPSELYVNCNPSGSLAAALGQQRALSIAGPTSPGLVTGQDEILNELQEVSSVPPLPLYALLKADKTTTMIGNVVNDGTSGRCGSQSEQDYSSLFHGADFEDDPFDDGEVFAPVGVQIQKDRKMSTSCSQSPMNYFGPHQARLLAKHLTRTRLPGLASLDQMYLLALADTVSTTKLDFADVVPDMVMKSRLAKEAGGDPTVSEGIDDCGLRYILAARHHVYLLNTLAIVPRMQLQQNGLQPAIYIWAFHSEAEEELMNVIPGIQKNSPTWKELRQFGIGWFVRNLSVLWRLIDKVAKTTFLAKNDPLDAAIFYLAMKKKTLLWGLFRSVHNEKMLNFFKNDFTQDRWRRAALKNAFALLGRQRYEHAIAFFLLSGAVKDAIEICLTKLEDLQLALVISRLHDTGPDGCLPQSYKKILYEAVLGLDQNGENYDCSTASPDPFLRSMACWQVGDYGTSLGTLLESEVGGPDDVRSTTIDAMRSSVFNFYNFLRQHPLIIRRNLANKMTDKSKSAFLGGFRSDTIKDGGTLSEGRTVMLVDQITPIERKLFFQTAHQHFKNGCPALALEVLSKLPDVIDMEGDITLSRSNDTIKSPKSPANFSSQDGMTSSSELGNTSSLVTEQAATAFDWSQPVGRLVEDKPNFCNLDDDEGDDGDDVGASKDGNVPSSAAPIKTDQSKMEAAGDVMAQQLKYVACLKLLMEEFSTLATGFEVDGGQLRCQLYLWLEQSVQVLGDLCGYQVDLDLTLAKEDKASTEQDLGSDLHEMMLSEKQLFQEKLQRTARRKKWLRTHQQILRTLLSYSVLHGSCGGGLASVRMELTLLLQELQQEKTKQQLLSPLPFPTSLPLLSASIASAKTVIAGPIHYLQSTVHDILLSICDIKSQPQPDVILNKVFVLRNLSAALSSCVYQCLCDSDTFVLSNMENFSPGLSAYPSDLLWLKKSCLLSGALSSEPSNNEPPNQPPSKWPGVSSLNSLLSQNYDESSPPLILLLCESLIAIYLSLLTHALAMYDAHILYRLVAHPFVEKIWPAMFGGGVRKQILVHTSTTTQQNAIRSQNELQKQRVRLQVKALGSQAPALHTTDEPKPTYKEKFVAPEISIMTYFMNKPYMDPADDDIGYDSAESFSDDEDCDSDSTRNDNAMLEHINTDSYSWCLLRYASVHLIHENILAFLPSIGIEISELGVCSPLINSAIQALSLWELQMKESLEAIKGPPTDYIPGCFVDKSVSGPALLKYKAIREAINTPFLSSHRSVLPVKRLWLYLVRKAEVHDIFIRYIFKKTPPRPENDVKVTNWEREEDCMTDPMKIVHRDAEMINAFCVNQTNRMCIAIGTSNEVIELDVSGIMKPPAWLADETEYDIEQIRTQSQARPEPDFLVVQTPIDRYSALAVPSLPVAAGTSSQSLQAGLSSNVIKGLNMAGISNPFFSRFLLDRSRRMVTTLTKRSVQGVRRIASHPQLPYYMTGAQDGCVRLWEWGHSQTIATARQPGSFPKVTQIAFNSHGNKFGVTDGEGQLCLWQVGLAVNMTRPYLSMSCHSKTASDFCFVGSSSFLATSGNSADQKNICLWDTLLPLRSRLVHGFLCHPDGATVVVYSSRHQTLISSGKKGQVCLFDVRQRQIRQTFSAHDSTSVKCITMNQSFDAFATGAVDGSIKMWNLLTHQLMFDLPQEHSKSSLLRASSAGVTQVYLQSDGAFFSCGADGSLKLRRLFTDSVKWLPAQKPVLKPSAAHAAGRKL